MSKSDARIVVTIGFVGGFEKEFHLHPVAVQGFAEETTAIVTLDYTVRDVIERDLSDAVEEGDQYVISTGSRGGQLVKNVVNCNNTILWFSVHETNTTQLPAPYREGFTGG